MRIKYVQGDPWVWCSHCRALFQCDAMDATCRLCHERGVITQVNWIETLDLIARGVDHFKPSGMSVPPVAVPKEVLRRMAAEAMADIYKR